MPTQLPRQLPHLPGENRIKAVPRHPMRVRAQEPAHEEITAGMWDRISRNGGKYPVQCSDGIPIQLRTSQKGKRIFPGIHRKKIGGVPFLKGIGVVANAKVTVTQRGKSPSYCLTLAKDVPLIESGPLDRSEKVLGVGVPTVRGSNKTVASSRPQGPAGSLGKEAHPVHSQKESESGIHVRTRQDPGVLRVADGNDDGLPLAPKPGMNPHGQSNIALSSVELTQG